MTGEVVQTLLIRDTYRDSVELMRIASDIEGLAGVRRSALLMGTPANLDLLARAGLLDAAAPAARPGDLVVAVAADTDEAGRAALARARDLFTEPPSSPTRSRPDRRPPRTIATAVADLPGANLAIISTPGSYATAEALKALKRGLHVFLFSDNVSLDDELELKRLGARRRLLVMGPDCGTAILEGVPLGFANAVRRGCIGLVAASGTGLQEVTCLVDRLGEGVSHAIGTGGRDLHERIGGLTMLAGIDYLLEDPPTTVIVLISKPPSADVARRVLERASAGSKPIVTCFLGGDAGPPRAGGRVAAATLEEAAVLAVGLARGGSPAPPTRREEEAELQALACAEVARLAPGQRAVRGLYSGGTLCSEASLLLTEALSGGAVASGHTLMDLGAEEFTAGRPHPMIDLRVRNELIVAAGDDPAIAVLLLDVVLGYGSHPDPAGALVPALAAARSRAARAGRHVIVVASICGAARDPQGLAEQEARLRAAGVLVQATNARAARLAARIALEAARG